MSKFTLVQYTFTDTFYFSRVCPHPNFYEIPKQYKRTKSKTKFAGSCSVILLCSCCLILL